MSMHTTAVRIALSLAASLLLVATAFGQAARTEPRAWTPAVSEALAAYYADDHVTALRICRHLLDTERDPAVRRDAALLCALAMTQMPARADRVEGMGRLAQLVQRDPSLIEDPECNLAFGIARTALSETGSALDALDHAVTGFAAQGNTRRQLAALVALAEAWSRHGEWEITPRRLLDRRPALPDEAEAIRRTRLDQLHAQLVKLPGNDQPLAQVDLIRAELLLRTPETQPQGLAILVQLAESQRISEPVARAALQLAQRHENEDRSAEALALYDRVRREWHGPLAAQAEERHRQLARPQIVIDCPASVRSGESATAHVRTRGLGDVQFEVRQVDVAAWLASASTRGREAALPISGSVRAARQLPAKAASWTWWDSDSLDEPLSFSASPAAYALIVQGSDEQGRPHSLKRLVLVTDLLAACLVGPRDALVWATRAPDAADSPPSTGDEELTGQFWMQRSFVPQRVEFNGGVARLALPPEAHLMRERRWYCLVRHGEHMALCSGELPATADDRPQPTRVALMGGPPEADVGDAFFIAGHLLHDPGTDHERSTDVRFELVIVDALEETRFARTLELSDQQTFNIQLPVTDELAGKHLRVFASHNGRILDNVLTRLAFSVPRSDLPRFRMQLDAPSWVRPGQPVPVSVRPEYPWGTWPRRARLGCWHFVFRLPSCESFAEPLQTAMDLREQWADDTSSVLTFAWPPHAFGVEDDPRVVRLDGIAASWEGRRGQAGLDLLYGPEPRHAWLIPMPGQPQVGQDLRFRLGWFEPGGRAVPHLPQLEIRREGSLLARLDFRPLGVWLISEAWRAPQPGLYEAIAEIPGLDAPPLTARRTIEVQPTPDGQTSDAAWLSGNASLTQAADRAGVQVRLTGTSTRPLLCVVEADDPLAARALTGLPGPLEFSLGLGRLPGPAHLLVLAMGRSGPELLLTREVTPQAAHESASRQTPHRVHAHPGSVVTLPIPDALRSSGAGSILSARLVEARRNDQANLRDAPVEWLTSGPVTALQIVGSDGAAFVPSGPVLRTAGNETPSPLPPALQAALGEGVTLWAACTPLDSIAGQLSIDIPDEPGLHKLALAAQAPNGTVRTDTLFVDARQALLLELVGPPTLLVGDRAEIAVRLQNTFDEPADVELDLQIGDTLSVRSLRVREADGQSTPLPTSAGTRLTIPPDSMQWIFVEVEATRLGSSEVGVSIACRSRLQRESCNCTVLPAVTAPPSMPELFVDRQVSVWARKRDPGTRIAPHWPTSAVDAVRAQQAGRPVQPQPPDPNGPDAAEDQDPMARWVPIGPGDTLLPGQLLLVREAISVERPLGKTTWTQRLPACCRAVASPPADLATVGTRLDTAPDRIVSHVDRLEPGAVWNEYCVAVVRPGEFAWPLPEVRLGEQDLPVAVDQADQRLRVAPR